MAHSVVQKGINVMCMERYVRLVAGGMILLSLVLSHFVSAWFFLLTAFVGLNLLQSSVTGLCPLEWILRALRVPHCSEP